MEPYFWGKIFPSLFGTAAGAALAFLAKSAQDRRDQKKKQKAAAHSALFVLALQSQYINGIQSQMKGSREEASPQEVWWTHLEVYSFPPEFPMEDLGFLRTSSESNVLFKLIGSRNYLLKLSGLVSTLNELKSAFKDAPFLQNSGIGMVSSPRSALHHEIKAHEKEFVATLEGADPVNAQAVSALTDALTKQFPGEIWELPVEASDAPRARAERR